ncbi:MAG: divergent polysaccharide deacetylase family protein [Calditrichaeota bacterium]|nr:divergent polysaccharide deacetylase family protein [Calditrichota bacterium]
MTLEPGQGPGAGGPRHPRLVPQRAPRRTVDRRYVAVAALAALAVLLFILNLSWRPGPPTEGPVEPGDQAKLWNAAAGALLKSGVKPEWMRRQGDELRVEVPPGVALQVLNFAVQAALREEGAEILVAKEELVPAKVELIFGLNNQPVGRVNIVESSSARAGKPVRVAIVVDDFGYRLDDDIKQLLALQVPLTIAVIPGLKKSGQAATMALISHKELIIHMPMEPVSGRVEDNGFAIYTTLPDDEIQARVEKAFDLLPAAKGMNNHEGSKATADDGTMRAVMRALKRHGAFFIDSRTTKQSRAYAIAKEVGVPCRLSDGFLDARDDEKWVRNKMWELIGRAPAGSKRLVICHPRKTTIKVLLDMIPKLAEQGVKFVYASEIVR